MPTPNELVYSTIEMLEGFRELPPAATFLNDTLFGEVRFFDGKHCQVDFYKARRLMAPLVKRGQLGRVVKRPPILTSYYDVPTIAPVRPINVADLEDRQFGEHVYDSRTPADRMAELVADDLIELRESISRRIEWMTSQLLFKGEISYKLDDGSTETLEYGPPVEVVPTVPWTVDGSDPFKDLSDAADAILTDSGAVADVIVFGNDVLDVFLRHAKVQVFLDVRRFNLGNVEPEERAGTAQFLGNLNRPYAAMYSYVEVAEREGSEAEQIQLEPMVPLDSLLIGSSTHGGRTAYGSITQMEQRGDTITVRGEPMVPLTLYDAQEQKQTFRLASRPCIIPSDMQSWRILKPLPATT